MQVFVCKGFYLFNFLILDISTLSSSNFCAKPMITDTLLVKKKKNRELNQESQHRPRSYLYHTIHSEYLIYTHFYSLLVYYISHCKKFQTHVHHYSQFIRTYRERGF